VLRRRCRWRTWFRISFHGSVVCVLFKDDDIAKLRSVGLRDVFAYADTRPDDLKDFIRVVPGHNAIVKTDPAYQRLTELRDALRPGSAGSDRFLLIPAALGE
jgi:hypothetical protein